MSNLKIKQSTCDLLSLALSILVALLGFLVMTGWILHISALIEMRRGLVAVVFNTALCFFLVGTALALPTLWQQPMQKLQTAVGIFIFILCALILGEHIYDKQFGIDWAFLHTWFKDGNTRPGRLAPNTAIGFMVIGSALVLMSRVTTKWRALTLQILTVLVLAIGITGLVGYTLSQDLLFGWARSARMAIPTAIGMILTSIAIWLRWHRAEWYRTRMYFQDDEKIALSVLQSLP
jgi:hypothetical protein